MAPAPPTSALLSTDLTTTTSSSHLAALPANISNATIPTQTIPCDTTVQIIDIRDIGRSLWTQIQDLEMEARGETSAGRNEIVRVVEERDDQDGEDHSAREEGGRGSAGPWKVLLQDGKGGLVYGFDGASVLDGARVGIGCKVLLKRGCRVDRGVVMMEREAVVVLGGRIEELDRVWRRERIRRLKRLLAEEQK